MEGHHYRRAAITLLAVIGIGLYLFGLLTLTKPEVFDSQYVDARTSSMQAIQAPTAYQPRTPHLAISGSGTDKIQPPEPKPLFTTTDPPPKPLLSGPGQTRIFRAGNRYEISENGGPYKPLTTPARILQTPTIDDSVRKQVLSFATIQEKPLVAAPDAVYLEPAHNEITPSAFYYYTAETGMVRITKDEHKESPVSEFVREVNDRATKKWYYDEDFRRATYDAFYEVASEHDVLLNLPQMYERFRADNLKRDKEKPKETK